MIIAFILIGIFIFIIAYITDTTKEFLKVIGLYTVFATIMYLIVSFILGG